MVPVDNHGQRVITTVLPPRSGGGRQIIADALYHLCVKTHLVKELKGVLHRHRLAVGTKYVRLQGLAESAISILIGS